VNALQTAVGNGKETRRSPCIGILAIQGDFAAHEKAIEKLGAATKQVRSAEDLAQVDALIVPGGESTTIAKGLARLDMLDALRERIRAGMAVLGTCAGAILLSRETTNQPVPVLGIVDATAVRNAYGTQVDSFACAVDEDCDPSLDDFRCVFIRAPQLQDVGAKVEVLARVDGAPVLVRQDNVLAATFHPELTDDLRVHKLLLDTATVTADTN
jgi:5'-phosphate synthase pdxT subunit